MQAQSAKLIGDAIQKNPAFLTLRKIEVLIGHSSQTLMSLHVKFGDSLMRHYTL